MDIAKFKAEIQAKMDQQQREWDRLIATRKQKDAEATSKLMIDVEQITRNQLNTCAQKLFGSLWK